MLVGSRKSNRVVKMIGKDNVVQVVTDNVANYKAAGQMFLCTCSSTHLLQLLQKIVCG